MKELNDVPFKIKRLEYVHHVEHKGETYIRNEYIILYPYDASQDIHNIRWRFYNEDEYQRNGLVEYFSKDLGWAKDGVLNINNPVPELEVLFKETIGKDLIYFNEK